MERQHPVKLLAVPLLLLGGLVACLIAQGPGVTRLALAERLAIRGGDNPTWCIFTNNACTDSTYPAVCTANVGPYACAKCGMSVPNWSSCKKVGVATNCNENIETSR
jgi:hypothetical protein